MSNRPVPESVKSDGVGFWRSVAWATFLIAGALSMIDPLALFSHSVTPANFSTMENVGPVEKANPAAVPFGASAANEKDAGQLFRMSDRQFGR